MAIEREPKPHRKTCRCFLCKARAREAEALSVGVRGDGKVVVGRKKRRIAEKLAEDILHADDPPIIVSKGESPRTRVAQWIALRSLEPGISQSEAARRLGLSPHTLNAIINRAVRAGWLQFDDSLSRIEHELIPKVIDNLSDLLSNKDRTVTIETAKGTIFKDYEKAKGLLEPSQTILAIKIEAPQDGGDSIKVLTGKIVGSPKTLEE